jgi:molybdenum cofactor synthesis domain-containing protein
VKAAVIVVSTSRVDDPSADESGPRLAAFAESLGASVETTEVVTDDRDAIEKVLRRCADELGCVLILTSGGTGFAPTDVTPEATRAAIEREAPGIAEAMRIASREHTPNWMLGRGIAGIRGRSLIVNFPGSPKSIDQAGASLKEALPHALALLRGERSPHR